MIIPIDNQTARGGRGGSGGSAGENLPRKVHGKARPLQQVVPDVKVMLQALRLIRFNVYEYLTVNS